VLTESKASLSWRQDAAWMFAVWLIAAVLIGGINGRRAFDYYRLSRNSIPVDGVAIGPKPHGQISYSYQVKSKTYQAVGLPANDAQPLNKIFADGKVTVHYLPYAPEVSCLGGPEELFSIEIVPVLIGSFLFPALILIRLAFRVRRKRRLALSMETGTQV
jgi:hypothetical protein